ncbi:RidA family protein [Saccharopolyspora sp. 5N708]|uniref:RidA family protein n=1 Tax=Saccharopolyspora sp. 5N708 TaxID=3457424 RepID=UPI003FD32CBA
MSIQRVNPETLARPAGFAHAVVADDCRLVFLAGQTALDATGKIVGDGIVAQFEQALGNILTALGAAGGSPEQLTELTIYIVDVADYRAHAGEIGAVWRKLVGRHYPAMAAVGATRLWDTEALVEIKGTAAIPKS